jgi:hypothetical protein
MTKPAIPKSHAMLSSERKCESSETASDAVGIGPPRMTKA